MEMRGPPVANIGETALSKGVYEVSVAGRPLTGGGRTNEDDRAGQKTR
jgi:hypothetical protein